MQELAKPHYFDDVVDMFEQGLLQQEIADIIGIKRQALAFQMKKFDFSFKRNSYRLSEAEIDTAVELYNEGKSTPEISEILGYSKHTILYALKLRDVTIKTKMEIKFYKDYTINEDAFSDLTTEESAYYYGWLVTDGWVSKNNVSIELNSKDLELLLSFKEYMKSSNLIFSRNREQKSGSISQMSSFGFSHKVVLDRLRELGLVENKSFITYCPEVFKYNRHFWRGVLEGDGHIEKSSNRIGVTGSYQLTKDFGEYCTSLCSSIQPSQSSKENVYVVRVSGFNRVKLVLDELYRDCELKLSRKYNVYLERYCDGTNTSR